MLYALPFKLTAHYRSQLHTINEKCVFYYSNNKKKHTTRTITCVSITILRSYSAAKAVVVIFVIRGIVDQARRRILNNKRIREENNSTSLPDCTSSQIIVRFMRVGNEGKFVTKEIL